ncbi:MAG: YbaN family protein [Lysobacteraceae bacterium]
MNATPPTPPDRPAPEPARIATPLRWFYIALAWVSLALGLIGVVLPGLPTTPFVLLAAWAAARSSPRLRAWLRAHPLFGPLIRDWQHSGAIHRRAKWTATVMMLGCAVVLFLLAPKPWMAVIASTVMAVVVAWLWARPEPTDGDVG